MPYAALVSLANTIDLFHNSNLYSISLEEKQQIISLLDYVTPFQQFLDEFPDKFNGLEGRMRALANEAEDILEYLVLEKVYLCSDEESRSEPHDLNYVTLIKDFSLKQENLYKEFRQDFADEALKGRFWDVSNAAKHINNFLWWEKDHIPLRDKWRFLPVEFSKFKSKPHFIDHLNKVINEIDSVTGEVMAMKNKERTWHCMKKIREEFDSIKGKVMSMIQIKEEMVQVGDSSVAAASSSDIDLHDDDDEEEEEEEEEEECYQSEKHKLQLKRVMEEIALIAAQVKEIKASSTNKDGQCGGADFSTLSPSSTAMVGFEDHVLDIKDRLCGEPSTLHVIPICGMGGIGKTTLARNLYEDPLIVSRFDVRVWVTISQDYSALRILSSILESLKEYNKGVKGQSDDEKVHKILMGRRYLVVMDDMWSGEAWDIARRVFPNDGNGSRVMLTTRLSDVASYPDRSSKIYEMPLLNQYDSWNLLKKNVFGDEDCPSELQDIGKKIARSCKGLPLATVVIAGLLSTTMRNLVSWKVIAENMKSAEHYQIEEILALSYVHLPQYLRPCFLYMGSFPEDHEIDVLKLIRLWIAEGFVKSPIDSDNFEKVAEGFLEELVKRNLVLVANREWDGRIKSCGVHDLMRDLCIRKSHENKFFLNMRDSRIGKESFTENIRNQRRVSVDSSSIEFLSSLHGSTIRSIRYSKNNSAFDSERLDFLDLESVRLLRVLDGEYFCDQDLRTLAHLDELLHLRYLAIRTRGGFPISLSRLQNLQTLVIYAQSSLRLKWCMSQLRHVLNDGTIDFEDPKETDCPLESLQTLSYVSLSTCRETILKMIPNLKRLQIYCLKGLSSDGRVCLDDLVHLHRLEDLEIESGKQVKYYKVTFPRMLKKLILRKWRVPWNDVFVFGSLPNLQVLELIDCGCVGGTWETTEGAFPVLEVLKISSSSFENWLTESSHFPRLKLLQLHFCYDLCGIPNDIGEIPTLELIKVKGDARNSLIESVELIREEQEDMGNNTLQVVCPAKPTDSGG